MQRIYFCANVCTYKALLFVISTFIRPLPSGWHLVIGKRSEKYLLVRTTFFIGVAQPLLEVILERLVRPEPTILSLRIGSSSLLRH